MSTEQQLHSTTSLLNNAKERGRSIMAIDYVSFDTYFYLPDWRSRTAGATGHRVISYKKDDFTNALGGYNRNHPLAVMLRTNTLALLEDFILHYGINRFISGGALGFDTMFFWCVNHLKQKYPDIENVVAVPFRNQWIKWERNLPEAVKWYFKMLEMADTVIDVAREEGYGTGEDQKHPYSIALDDYSTAKMKKRNQYMVDQLRLIAAFFDGSNSGTGNAVKYAKTRPHHPKIMTMNPQFDCAIQTY